MRLPNVHKSDDVIDLASMPPTGGTMELDHRTCALGQSTENAVTRSALTMSIVGALLATLAVRWGAMVLPVAPWLQYLPYFGLAVALAPFVALWQGLSLPSILALFMRLVLLFAVASLWLEHGLIPRVLLALLIIVPTALASLHALRGSPLAAAAMSHLFLTVLFVVFALTFQFSSLLLFLPVLGYTLLVSHQIVRHSGLFMHASPWLDRTTRMSWLSVWEPGDPRAPRTPDLQSAIKVSLEQRERHRYRRTHLAISTIAVTSVGSALALPGPYNELVGVCMLSGGLLLFSLVNAATYQSGNIKFGLYLVLFWSSVRSFLTYNIHGTFAPGVFQSPIVSRDDRARLVSVAFFLTAFFALHAACYFPAVVLWNDRPWAAASTLDHGDDDWDEWPFSSWPESQRQSLEHVYTTLSKTEWEQFRRLPTRKARVAFLEQLRDARAVSSRAEYEHDIHLALHDNPRHWVLVALRGSFQGIAETVWAILISVVLSLIAIVGVPFAVHFAASSRILAHFYLTLDAPGALYQRVEGITAFQAMMQRISQSQHEVQDAEGNPIRERDHILVGWNALFDYPVLLPIAALKQHAWITGGTGTGKTSRSITPLVHQLAGRARTSIVIFDGKGDEALLAEARASAKANGLPFKLWTNTPGRPTHVFNPFEQGHSRTMSRSQVAALISIALDLEHGSGYGAGFFSTQNRSILLQALRAYPEIDSFAALDHFLNNVKDFRRIPKTDREKADHALKTMRELATIHSLNVSATTVDGHAEAFEQRIDFASITATPQVIYFFVQPILEEATARRMFQLGTFCLMTALALERSHDQNIYLIQDEFQQAASRGTQILLDQARSLGVSLILANQSLDALKLRDVDLRTSVLSNPNYEVFFGASDPKMQRLLVDLSTERRHLSASWPLDVVSYAEGAPRTMMTHYSNRAIPATMTEQIVSRETLKDVTEMTAAPELCYVRIKRPQPGYDFYGGHLMLIRTAHHISREEYARRLKHPWPEPGDYPGLYLPPVESVTAVDDESANPWVMPTVPTEDLPAARANPAKGAPQNVATTRRPGGDTGSETSATSTPSPPRPESPAAPEQCPATAVETLDELLHEFEAEEPA